jgi:hypothetical protein
LQQKGLLFDHLVRDCEHPGWDCEAERFRRAEVDHKLQFGGLRRQWAYSDQPATSTLRQRWRRLERETLD